jgi:integrase
MRLPKSDNASQRWLTDDECDRLLGALPGEWRDLAEVSLLTGLRMGELKRLRGHDVSGESATCSFIGKSGKRETAPLTDRALEILLSRARGPAPLFGPVHDRVFYRAVDLCGLNPEGTDPRMRVRFHTFRHTFASRLVQAGVDLYLVQRLMRHSSPAMTQRYAHLRSADLRAALAKALPTRIA